MHRHRNELKLYLGLLRCRHCRTVFVGMWEDLVLCVRCHYCRNMTGISIARRVTQHDVEKMAKGS